MGRNYLSAAAARAVNPPQSEPLNKRQVKNNAGGFVYAVDDWKRLDRFLILGSEGGTYYVSEHDITKTNINTIMRVVAEDGIRVVNRVIEISDSGRAPKNDPALFVLAYAASKGDLQTRSYALNSLPKVARIGTHLFHFVDYARKFRGMGRGLRSAITEWYASKNASQLASQVTKYQSRDGWSHRDLLRLVHPHFEGAHQVIARWVVKGELEAEDGGSIPRALLGHVAIQKATDPKEAAEIIREFGVVRESVPTQLLNSPEVWEALLENMPLTALIRNLGNMSKVGLLVPMSDASKLVVSRLTDNEALKKARIHPIQLLLAAKVYGQGKGMKGSGSWTVVPKVAEALDDGFYASFKFVQPTGKRHYIGVDVSGSMGCGTIAGTPLTPREGAAALSLVTARTEEEYYIAGFQSKLVKLPFSSKTTLKDAVNRTANLSFGSTDCAAPMLDALAQGIKADVFEVITDNETWAGNVHPMVALQNYRNKTGINAKLVVVGMTATEFTIADPADAGTLDVVGFDASAPAVIADFVRE